MSHQLSTAVETVFRKLLCIVDGPPRATVRQSAFLNAARLWTWTGQHVVPHYEPRTAVFIFLMGRGYFELMEHTVHLGPVKARLSVSVITAMREEDRTKDFLQLFVKKCPPLHQVGVSML